MKYPSAPRKSTVAQTNGNRRKTVSAPKASNDSDSEYFSAEKKQVQTGSGDVEVDGTKEVGASGDTSSKVARKLVFSSEQKGSGGGGGGNLKVGVSLGTKRMSFVFDFRREGCRG